MLGSVDRRCSASVAKNVDYQPKKHRFIKTIRRFAPPVGIVIATVGSAYYAWIQTRANVEADPARMEIRLPNNDSDKAVVRQYFVNRGTLTAEQVSVHSMVIFLPSVAMVNNLLLPERWQHGDPIDQSRTVPSPDPMSVGTLPKDASANTLNTTTVGREPGQLDPSVLIRLRNPASDAQILALARITYRDAFYIPRTRYSCLIWRPAEPKAVVFCGRWNS